MHKLKLQKRVSKCWIQVLSVHTNVPTPPFEVWIDPVLLSKTWQVHIEVWTDRHQYNLLLSSMNFPNILYIPNVNFGGMLLTLKLALSTQIKIEMIHFI